MNKTLLLSAVLTAGILALAGCASTGASTGPDAGSAAPGSATAGASASADLATADSSLGKIVVDGEGLTAYVFDKDTANATTSACTGQCASLWPAIETTSDSPKVEGVTGTIGTITAVDGGKQLTLNGMPLYTYASDSAPGDVNGQGFSDVWWVISPAGDKITAMAGKGGY